MNRIQMFLFLNSFASVNMTHVCNSGHESITKEFLVPFKSDKYTRCDADDINENFLLLVRDTPLWLNKSFNS